jgi:hypothetical protein
MIDRIVHHADVLTLKGASCPLSAPLLNTVPRTGAWRSGSETR